ncbi:hypothetical protein HMPREF9086_3271 [Enterobacter hormaechei ATCC 49162]|nr:hypothetical protein HMPREF9086_3271 [Enterobacter hormaechei ATCC 49162]
MALRYIDAGNRQILGRKQWAIFYHCGPIPQCRSLYPVRDCCFCLEIMRHSPFCDRFD